MSASTHCKQHNTNLWRFVLYKTFQSSSTYQNLPNIQEWKFGAPFFRYITCMWVIIATRTPLLGIGRLFILSFFPAKWNLKGI